MPKTKAAAQKASGVPASRMSFQDTMSALEKAGSVQTRKTYARHGVPEPMFGVSFATLKTLYKRIRVDHELAQALWSTGNFDARNLAVKIADPASISSRELDRWAATPTARMCGGYVAHLADESPHGCAKADKWLAASDDATQSAVWNLVVSMAKINESTEDSWFAERLVHIEKAIHSAPNTHRYLMNNALIAIGGRNASLCKSAAAAAKRIGTVEVDHGDTDCKTPVCRGIHRRELGARESQGLRNSRRSRAFSRVDADAVLGDLGDAGARLMKCTQGLAPSGPLRTTCPCGRPRQSAVLLAVLG